MAEVSDVQFLAGTLEMEHPNKFIDSFAGVITLEGKWQHIHSSI